MPGRWLFWFLAVSFIILAQNALEGAALVQALQKGDYVIYFRHADTDGARGFRLIAHVLAEDWAKLTAR
ncbi:hypothetical protein [Calidithermus roseus]|uniref:Histidine phosphatase superfamily (Branch 1) n=1 Tax=Calidithermus roseus TaxID=1644118 RepID=A0A399EM46_9DEIN|nr:hypothetical protein [Calidithermus roseus]RIH84563.1 hypothetical protein Mrose_02580 [Calidithermus roseus]